MVKVTDDDTGSGSLSTPVTVNNVAPSVLGLNVSNNNINEGQTTTLTIAFTDPGTLDTHTATVNWGDGSATSTVSLSAGVRR